MISRWQILILCCAVVASCAAAHAADAPLMSATKLIKVPLTRQATDYTCGAAAVQSVIGFYGENIREAALAKELRTTPAVGTAYKNIVSFAKRHGYKSSIYRNCPLDSLTKLVDTGTPVICLIQAWPDRKVHYATDWSDGHYVVAVGHDATNIYFMDPCTLGKYTFIPRDEFLTRWHDTDDKEKLVHFAMTLTKSGLHHNPDEIVKMD